MEIITKYIANDGKEFDDEYECLRHEWEIRLVPETAGVRIWGYDMERLDPADTSVWSNGSVYYVAYKNMDTARDVQRLLSDMGFGSDTLPDYHHVTDDCLHWWYDERRDAWTCIDTEMSHFYNCLKMMKE